VKVRVKAKASMDTDTDMGMGMDDPVPCPRPALSYHPLATVRMVGKLFGKNCLGDISVFSLFPSFADTVCFLVTAPWCHVPIYLMWCGATLHYTILRYAVLSYAAT
jgi:hypothetical protein